MRVGLFEGGGAGELVRLPGEWPEAELSELVGGEIAMRALCRGLKLVSAAEAGRRVPAFELRLLGRAPELIHGPLAVVAEAAEGRLRDLRPEELARAEEYLLPIGA